MINGFLILSVTALFAFSFTGCGAKSTQQGQTAEKEVKAPIEKNIPEKIQQDKELQEKAEPVDPCKSILQAAIEKARKTRRTAQDTCGENKIDVTPMWSMNYDGTVHIRIYDNTGKIVLDEYRRKP